MSCYELYEDESFLRKHDVQLQFHVKQALINQNEIFKMVQTP